MWVGETGVEAVVKVLEATVRVDVNVIFDFDYDPLLGQNEEML